MQQAALGIRRREVVDRALGHRGQHGLGGGVDRGSVAVGDLVAELAQCQVGPDSTIVLDVNGAKRQSSTIGKLIWSIPEIIEHVSAAWTLAPGDLIFTGTPEGVAAVVAGDTLSARIDGVGTLQVQVVQG